MARSEQRSEEYAAFVRALDAVHLTPLWEQLHVLVPERPQPVCVPALWRYEQLRPHLLHAGELVSAEQAVRRVLVMENPALRGQSAITTSLYAGWQLILPGEVAPSHRHSQSALRLVLEGDSAFTVVDGEPIPMHPGDFVITPSWTWHDHGNPRADEGGTPVVWLDGLDIPMLRFFNAGFAENLGQAEQPRTAVAGASLARFGQALLPVRHRGAGGISPLSHYPYARSREALELLSRRSDPDPCDGIKLRYANPATGGWAMPTIGTCLQLLPRGFSGRPYRCTDATVFSVVEGSGQAVIDGQALAFLPRDTFVVPSWMPLRLCADADADCVLFSFSDRPVQEAMGVLRESREAA